VDEDMPMESQDRPDTLYLPPLILRRGALAMGAVVLVLGGAYAVTNWRTEREHTFEYLISTAKVQSRTVDRYMRRFERELVQLRDAIFDSRGRLVSSEQAYAVMRGSLKTEPDWEAVSIMSPSGRIELTSSLPFGEPAPSPARRPDDRVFQAIAALQGDAGMHIDYAYRDPTLETWVVPLRLGVRDERGRLTHVVTAALSLARPLNLWEGVDFPAGGGVGIVRVGEDVRLVGRYPLSASKTLEETFVQPGAGEFEKLLLRGDVPGSGAFQSTSSLIGVQALWGYARLEHYPLAFFIHLPASFVWDRWWARTWQVFVLLAFVLIGGFANYRWTVAQLDVLGRERRRAEGELQESQDKLHLYVEHAPSAIAMFDRDMRYIAFSQRWLLDFKLGDRDLRGLNHYDVFPDLPKQWKAVHKRCLEGVVVEPMERTYPRADGSIEWLRSEIHPWRAKGGAIGGIIIFAEVITKRKLAEIALQESEQEFRETFELAGSGMAHVSLDGRFLRVNRKLSEILGYPEEELIGRSVKSISYPEDRDVADALVERIRKGELESGKVEKRYVHKDGSVVWVGLVIALARDVKGAPKHEIAVVEDITQRRRADEHIRRLTRVYAVLSGINALIVRVRERGELFEEVCRIALNVGKFPLAWIGVVDETRTRVEILTSSGDTEGYIEQVPLRIWTDRASAPGPKAQAVIDGRPEIVNDIASDPHFPLKEESLKRGFRSCVTLPLLTAGRVAALLVLYAEQTGFFDPEEMHLLEELANDISFALDHIEKANRLDYLAYYDELTGLTNRRLLRERLAQPTGSASGERRKYALCLLDVDRFRNVNDTLGRQAGDTLLRQIAKRLLLVSGDARFTARVDVNTFALVVPSFADEASLGRIVETKLRQLVSEEFAVAETRLRISMKMGVALFPADGTDPETLLRKAEAALKRAKRGPESYLFYTEQMTARVAENLALENKLRRALEREEFLLHYQPKVDAASGRVLGVEALIRWQDPEGGLLPPLEFIPLLEETGLILSVGAWVLGRAATDYRRWWEQGFKDIRAAVNVSPLQLRERNFVATVKQAIQESLPPAGIDLEITEGVVMEDIKGNIEKLQAVRELGLNIAIDDFGTGYSSLGYLSKLPVQSLKIDRSFVATMIEDRNNAILIATIVSMAHTLGLKVIAEGVETDEQARALRSLRCDEMQGNLVSAPLPLDQLLEFMAAR
jgi:PAS domain S-box-containing protein/diguanylate cyclase (GGDEF)-like protein